MLTVVTYIKIITIIYSQTRKLGNFLHHTQTVKILLIAWYKCYFVMKTILGFNYAQTGKHSGLHCLFCNFPFYAFYVIFWLYWEVAIKDVSSEMWQQPTQHSLFCFLFFIFSFLIFSTNLSTNHCPRNFEGKCKNLKDLRLLSHYSSLDHTEEDVSLMCTLGQLVLMLIMLCAAPVCSGWLSVRQCSDLTPGTLLASHHNF